MLDPQKVDALFEEARSRLAATSSSELRAAFDEYGEPIPEPLYETRGTTAVIALQGAVMKRVPWLFSYFGIAAAGCEQIQEALLAADSDPSILEIELAVDSGG